MGQASSHNGVEVLVPIFNEADLVQGVVDGINKSLADEPNVAITVLDDGSTDWTNELEQRLSATSNVEIRHFDHNRGKGAVLNDTFVSLTRPITVVIDGDGEYDPADIPAILAKIRDENADWVLGSRYGFGRPRPPQYVSTFLANKVMNSWFKGCAGFGFNDFLSGLYAFKTSCVKNVRLKEERFSFVPELILRAHHQSQARFDEVPISYQFRKFSDGKKIKWWETFTILAATFRYRRKSS